MLITPIFVQMVLEYSALQSGLVVMPLSLSMFVTSNSVPLLRNRFSSRPLLQFGMVNNTTAGRFGISLGTALAGTLMLVGLTARFGDLTASSEILDEPAQDAVADALERDVRIISSTELEELLDESEADPELQAEIIRINTEARPQALRLALLAPLLAGFVGLATSTRLPHNPATDVPSLPEITPDERTDP